MHNPSITYYAARLADSPFFSQLEADPRALISKAVKSSETTPFTPTCRHETARYQTPGHFVASAMVVDLNKNVVLVIDHKFLEKTLWPGGHIDDGEDAMLAALREVREETGVISSPILDYPIDVDSHLIPENEAKGEGVHYHHDLLFLAMADSEANTIANEAEVNDAKWVDIEDARFISPRFEKVIDRMKKILDDGLLVI